MGGWREVGGRLAGDWWEVGREVGGRLAGGWREVGGRLAGHDSSTDTASFCTTKQVEDIFVKCHMAGDGREVGGRLVGDWREVGGRFAGGWLDMIAIQTLCHFVQPSK